MAVTDPQNVDVVLDLLRIQLELTTDRNLRQAIVLAQMTIEQLRTPDLHIRMDAGDTENPVLLHDVPNDHFASYGEDYGKAVPFLCMRNLGQQWAVAQPTVYNHGKQRWDMNVHWFTSKMLADRRAAEVQLGLVMAADNVTRLEPRT